MIFFFFEHLTHRIVNLDSFIAKQRKQLNKLGRNKTQHCWLPAAKAVPWDCWEGQAAVSLPCLSAEPNLQVVVLSKAEPWLTWLWLWQVVLGYCNCLQNTSGALSVPVLVLDIRNVQTSQTPSAMRIEGDGSLSQVPVSSGVTYYSAQLSKQQLHGRRKIFSVLPCPFSAGPYSSCFLLIPGVTAPFSALLSPDSEKPYTERWYLWFFFFIAQVP